MNATATKNKQEATPVKQSEQNNATPPLRILKVGTCPSLSQKSQLTYHVGCNDKSELFFRVYANSSSGYFSREWVSLNAIQEAFAKTLEEGVIKSSLMRGLFVGQSTNTPGFVFAALLTEGLVQPSSIVDRCYECTDGKAFFAEVQALIESDVNLDADAKPKKSSKKKAASESAPSAE